MSNDPVQGGAPEGSGTPASADVLTEQGHDRDHLPGQYKAWCSQCKAVSESLRPGNR